MDRHRGQSMAQASIVQAPTLLQALTEQRRQQFAAGLGDQERQQARLDTRIEPLDFGQQQTGAQQQSSPFSNIDFTSLFSSGAGGMPGFNAAGASGSTTAGGLPAWSPMGFEGTGALGSGSSAGGASSGWMSGLGSAGPWAALAAAIIANENYQGNIGNRDDENFTGEYALTGRSAFMDKDVWGDKADDIIPGLGSGIRIAGGMSSPIDMLEGDTWSDIWDELKSGGMLGGMIKEWF